MSNTNAPSATAAVPYLLPSICNNSKELQWLHELTVFWWQHVEAVPDLKVDVFILLSGG